jgi:LDH2 family malate/lactate/ureidoglycolate dehydrogenase
LTLEAFHVREEDTVRVDEGALRQMTHDVIAKMGVPSADAELAADVLVTADVRGHESHGVSNMLRAYVTGFGNGQINPRPNWEIVRARPSTATIDCDRGLGIIVGPKAMQLAIDKARQAGMGVVSLGNGQHIGMAQYHAMLALPHDMIGVCMTATTPVVPPTFGREGRLGTNPIAFAAPAGEEDPFVLDMATSTIAVNKFRNAQRNGALLPPGTFARPDGTPVMEPALLPDEYLPLPLGTSREMGSHKGYGLACMVEILCSILSGSGFAARNGPGFYQHMVAAYSIDAFIDVPEFKDAMDDFLRTLKATKPAAGHDRVLVPGQPEVEATIENRAKGIPLHREVVESLRDMCDTLDVAFGL